MSEQLKLYVDAQRAQMVVFVSVDRPFKSRRQAPQDSSQFIDGSAHIPHCVLVEVLADVEVVDEFLERPELAFKISRQAQTVIAKNGCEPIIEFVDEAAQF